MAKLTEIPGNHSALQHSTIIASPNDFVANSPALQNNTPDKQEANNNLKEDSPDSGYHSPDDTPNQADPNEQKLSAPYHAGNFAATGRDKAEGFPNAKTNEESALDGFPTAVDSFLKLRNWRDYTQTQHAKVETSEPVEVCFGNSTSIEEKQAGRRGEIDNGSVEGTPYSLSNLTALQEALIDIRDAEFAPNLDSPTPQPRDYRSLRSADVTRLPSASRINSATTSRKLFQFPEFRKATKAGPSNLRAVTTVEGNLTPPRTGEVAPTPCITKTQNGRPPHTNTPSTVAGYSTHIQPQETDTFPWMPQAKATLPTNSLVTFTPTPTSLDHPLSGLFPSSLIRNAVPLYSNLTAWPRDITTISDRTIGSHSSARNPTEKEATAVPQHVRQIAETIKERQLQRQQQLGNTAVQAFRPSHTVQHSYGLLTEPLNPPLHRQPPLIPFYNFSAYQGDITNAANRSALIPDSANCALWIIGLPCDVTYTSLLASIRDVGNVYATVINPAGATHLTSAAKIVFFTRASAETLLYRIQTGTFHIQNKLITNSRWNKIKSAEYPQRDHSRAIRIQGPAELMDFAFFELFFTERITYNLDRRFEVECGVRGMRAQEWHFGSLRCQAASAKTAVERELQGIFEVRWARDPCAFL